MLSANMVDQIMNYQEYITIEPGKRGGKPCIRSMRITVYDVLDWWHRAGVKLRFWTIIRN